MIGTTSERTIGMIQDAKGNLLQANAEAIVNTVNCVGFMGKGIALQFKQAWPTNFAAYTRACERGDVQPGRILIHETGRLLNPKYIINFPTKRHWRGNSRIEDIAAGLVALIAEVKRLGIRSIALPPLGCGNGGLSWATVRPLIAQAFADVPDVLVQLFAPAEPPPAATMPVNTTRPRMTPARALFIKLMEQYADLEYRRTLLEVQKLAYFLQEAGEPLKLRYEAGLYGPYASNLNKVLERIEGHFIRGYGDSQRPDAEIDILPGAVDEADAFLQGRLDSLIRLERVRALIEGFETPYGMELLATVHWVAVHGAFPARTLGEAVDAVHGWNARKQAMFHQRHINLAFERLAANGWILT